MVAGRGVYLTSLAHGNRHSWQKMRGRERRGCERCWVLSDMVDYKDGVLPP